jgi:hypothetical protein
MIILDIPALLDELCVRLDLCLDPNSRARISIAPPKNLDDFERAILIAEGLDPLETDRRLRHDLRECIKRFAVDRDK